VNNNIRRVALITGGSRGIGKAIASAFAEAGYAVVINYNKSGKDALAIQKDLSAEPAAVSLQRADVSDAVQAKQMIDNVVSEFGRLDVLVNNAGINRDGYLMLMPDDDWNNVISVNLTGIFNCCRAAISHMISQRSGVIINMSSLSGISGLPGQANYAAAKGGVIAFTKSLAKELAPFSIRVNAVAPGAIETEMMNALNEETKKSYISAIPLKRFGQPREVAAVVRFLASEDASYITGETICVTGGLH